MTWNLEFDAPKGERFHRYGHGVKVWGDRDLWWCDTRRQWVPLSDNIDGLSNNAPCRTLKAFKRHLRKHSDVLKGQDVIWCNRFAGGNVVARWSK